MCAASAISNGARKALPGLASSAGTLRYSLRGGANAASGLPVVLPEHFRKSTGPADSLTWSSIGMGTNLGEADDMTDRRVTEAVVQSVLSGACNVIDTAINYREQRAEKAVGEALQRLIALDKQGSVQEAAGSNTENGGESPQSEQHFRRDEIIVCSKVGYLPFDDSATSSSSSDVAGLTNNASFSPSTSSSNAKPPPGWKPGMSQAETEQLRCKQSANLDGIVSLLESGAVTDEDIVGGIHCMAPAFIRQQLEVSMQNLQLENGASCRTLGATAALS